MSGRDAYALPCPVCGSVPSIVGRHGAAFVHCRACLHSGTPHQAAPDAIQDWNAAARAAKAEKAAKGGKP